MRGSSRVARVLRVVVMYALAIFLVVTFDTGVVPARGSSNDRGSLTEAVVDGVILWTLLVAVAVGRKLLRRRRSHSPLRRDSAHLGYEK
jgi:hypothetical protein